MNLMLMQPINQTFQEMTGNGVKYIIPQFQRDYTWGQDQWADLWADIQTLPDKSFAEKQSLYKNTGLKLAQKVASYPQWDKQAVDVYQDWLAQQASKAWSIAHD